VRLDRLLVTAIALELLGVRAAAAHEWEHPTGDVSVEACKAIWRGRPQREERCLVARRDMFEALQRSPYSRIPAERMRQACLRREVDGDRGAGCMRDQSDAARTLARRYAVLHEDVGHMRMWHGGYEAQGAQKELERLEWCREKYRPHDDPTTFDQVVECMGWEIERPPARSVARSRSQVPVR
jgi:hypothetical protein